jgi:hypothetical protein
MKVRREGVFSTIAKAMSKFAQSLFESSIRDFCNHNAIIQDENLKEKLLLIVEKTLNYFALCENISAYLQKEENSGNEKVIELFLQSNKIGKITLQEAKAKIVNKFIENLEKMNIKYDVYTLIKVVNECIRVNNKDRVDLNANANTDANIDANADINEINQNIFNGTYLLPEDNVSWLISVPENKEDFHTESKNKTSKSKSGKKEKPETINLIPKKQNTPSKKKSVPINIENSSTPKKTTKKKKNINLENSQRLEKPIFSRRFHIKQ